MGLTDGAAPGSHSHEKFGTLLRRLREVSGWTQEELAERAGLTSHGISALERGVRSRPYPHTVRSLADALGLDEADRARLLASAASRTPTRAAGRRTGTLRGLPAPVTPLIGREADLAALGGLLDQQTRLLTLTGPGGVGKTRLAYAVASNAAHRFPDGVVAVQLAAVEQAALMLPAIGRALGVAGVEVGGDEPVLNALRGAGLLLVLDNLEQIPDAGSVVAAVLETCPSVVVLATSRAALRLRGESEYAVQPLALPMEVHDLTAVEASPAGALFLARARAVSTGFASTRADAEAVAMVCRRLAGIPLALELAAARARLLSPRMLLERLGETSDQGGARDLPERQRTMRATLEWSYRLLSEAEQALFRRLSVFTGGGALDAVERVGADLPQVLESLERLVEHSLVVVATLPDGSVRYTMLEPVHQFAAELLTGDERAATSRHHAQHYLAMATEAAPHFEGGGDQVLWLKRTDQDDANLVSAIEWWIHHGDGDTAGLMVWSVWLYWWLRGRLLEGRRLAEATLELSLEPATRVRALLVTASMAFAQGHLELSGTRWRQARDLAQASDDQLGLCFAIAGVGLAALALGDLDTAGPAFTAVLETAQAWCGPTDWVVGLCHVWLGTVSQLRGDTAGAGRQCELGLANARRRGDLLTTYVALYGLVQAALAQHRLDDARALLAEGIELSAQTGDLANLSFFLESLGVVEGSSGRHLQAAQLLGVSDGLRDRVGSAVYGYYLPDPALRVTAERRARSALGDDAIDAELLHGRSMTPDEAVAAAVARAVSDADETSRRNTV